MSGRGFARLVVPATTLVLIAAVLAWLFQGDDIKVTASQAEATIGAASSAPPIHSRSGEFVPSGSDGPAEVWAVGDGAARELAGAGVARLIKRSGPDRFLYLGDVYENGTAGQFARNYAPTFGKFAEITAPTLGNHEAANAADGYDPYWQGVYGTPPPSFYSFELAGWKILSLNSEVAHGPRSAQVQWLDGETRGGGNCRLAFWHRPRYAAGTTHGDDPGLQPLWDALSAHARLIVNGHEHNMERLKARQGMTELIAGSGGKSQYPIDFSYNGLRFGDDKHFGALRLRLRPGHASYAFVSEKGRTLDSGSVRCRS